MAGKKDFTDLDTDLGMVFGNLEQATGKKGQQGEVTPQEKKEREEAMRTQGRKGCKAVRINMAFSSSNYNFVKTMARATGRTMTEFTNSIISAYQREHPEYMRQAEGFLEYVNSGAFSDLDDQGE